MNMSSCMKDLYAEIDEKIFAEINKTIDSLKDKKEINMLRFIQTTNKDAAKLLTWDKCSFEDGNEIEHPIKKITFNVEAGGVATVLVERYAMNNLFTAVSDDPKDESKPLTYKTHYAVEDIVGDIQIKVKGPISLSK